MSHLDFGTICPIFNEGVEKELPIQIKTSGCISIDQAAIKFGREVVVIEAYARYTGSVSSDTGSSSVSCTIGIFKGTLSTTIGSIAITSANAGSCTDECVAFSVDGSVTSTAFTSTDVLCIAMTSKTVNAYKCNVYIRYREK